MKAKTKALAGWFGGARMIAEHVGNALRGCKWVGVPFAGGMSELLHIDASGILVSDKHRHIINLARVVQLHREVLQKDCRQEAFHEDTLAQAQSVCRSWESNYRPDPRGTLSPHYEAGKAYFICCWMARGGQAGKDKEFETGFSFRWDSGGGDSAVRFRSATESLAAWDNVMPRCTFVCLDAFDFLAECKDKPECGIYLDPPWPDDGDGYKHKFSVMDQWKLASRLSEFSQARIVIRYGDHPLVRNMYPESAWNWQKIEGRTQGNNAKAEVLITRKDSP